MFVGTAQGITPIVAERDEDNNAGLKSSLVLSNQLMKIGMRAFTNTIARQKPRLETQVSESEVEKIAVQFKSMKAAYRESPSFRNAMES